MTIKSDTMNTFHTYFLNEMSKKVLPNKSKYTPTFQGYITDLVKLANTNTSTDLEAVTNAKSMLAIYQKIVNYCYGRTLSVLLKDLLSAVQTIKTRTATVI